MTGSFDSLFTRERWSAGDGDSIRADEIVFRHPYEDDWRYILHRAEEDPVEEMKKPLPNRPWHSSDDLTPLGERRP